MSAKTRSALVTGLVLLTAGLTLAACTENGAPPPPAPTAAGDPRGFAMGISSLPSELTQESYERTFELAGSAGDVILIQRTPPWQELLDGRLSEETVRTAQREIELAEEYGLDIFVAIDPTDGSERRSRLAGLPDELLGAGFADEAVYRALIDYARFVTETYKPRYLALGVEINSYQQHHPQDFERFVILYHEAYEAVKEISPETLVFPTFQVEELQGLLPVEEPLPPQWYLISRFEPRLDMLAVSSYPGLVYETADDIPDSYYARLALYTERPIAITGMGYTSQAGEDGERSDPEESQALFLRRTLDNAQQLAIPLVIWFVGMDPTFTGDTPLNLLDGAGLIHQDETPKPAWLVWLQVARRPLDRELAGE